MLAEQVKGGLSGYLLGNQIIFHVSWVLHGFTYTSNQNVENVNELGNLADVITLE